MPFVSVLDLDVHYVEHGAAAGEAERTAVFLHGFPLDHRSAVASFEPAFAARPGWRRVYCDFPGMGRTRAPEWVASSDDVLRVTAAFVDAVVPGPYVVGGCSFGGYIAAGLAAADPERVNGLALIVPMVLPHAKREVAVHSVLYREPGVTGSEMDDAMSVIITAETVRRNRDEIEVALADADQDAVDRIGERYEGSFPLVPASGPYEHPALVITGRQDHVLGFNDQWRLYGQWPRATFAVLDRGGHGLSIELPSLHDALVGDWLDRVESSLTRGESPEGV